jgi:recombination associated protein RdgC
MWFKNILFYRFTKPFTTNLETIENRLGEKLFQPCSPNEASRIGWSRPIDTGDSPLVHVCGKFWMLCLKKQERILPSSVVNEQVAIRASEIEAQQHRKVSRKEKAEIKEQVTLELLPKSFTKTVKHYAYLCPEKGYLVINTSSAKLADEYTSFLRTTLGSLPVRVPAVNQSPATIMTSWLRQDEIPPATFEIQDETELASSGEEKSSIKYKGIELSDDQIEQHVALGLYAKKLAMKWNDSISFILGDDLSIKRVKFGDILQDKLDDINAEGAAEQFDAGFSIMAMEFDLMIPDLFKAFGGEDLSAIVSDAA